MNNGLINAVFTMAVIVTILVWGVSSLANNDPVWFLSNFDAQAEEITIYWDGKVLSIKSTDPGYNNIMQAFAEAISKPAGYEGKVVFSEENISLYKEKHRLLVMNFQQSVQVHTRYPYAEANTFLVPLDGTHAYMRRAFAFTGFVPYASGPISMKETAFNDLYTAVQNVAIE
jgi:hypothetical protein